MPYRSPTLSFSTTVNPAYSVPWVTAKDTSQMSPQISRRLHRRAPSLSGVSSSDLQRRVCLSTRAVC